MSVKSCEKVEKSQMALTIEVGAEEFQAAVEKAYRKMRQNIRVQGFRPGKAPRKLIEKMYGPEVFYEEAINIAFPDAYEAAVKEQELQVVGYPAVELVGSASAEGFTFKATVPVYPEVTLGQYKGLSAPKAEVQVTADDVDQRIKSLQERNTRLVSVEREAREGDTAVIDFEGFLNGTPFDGGKGENHSLELGSHSFVPGFEEQIVGMKAGDEKDIDITFPEDYQEDLAGKAVVFKVKVHEVKEKDAPELDDEFAKDVSEFDTLQELKADIEKKITEDRQREADRNFEDALIEQVADNLTVEVPDAMVDNQCRQYLENFRMQIAQSGIPYDQYMKITGNTEAKILADAREPAQRQVRVDLAVAAIIKAENIEISDEDVEAEYQKLAEQYNMELEMVKKYLTTDQVKDQLASRRAVEIVAESATATKPEAKDAADAKPEAEETADAKPEAEDAKPEKEKKAKKADAAEGEEKPKRTRKSAAKKAEDEASAEDEKPKTTRKKKAAETEGDAE